MNPLIICSFLLCLFASAMAIFDGGLTLVGTNLGLAATSTTGGALFVTNAGLVAGGLGLLGAGIVKAALLANLASRSKRQAEDETEENRRLIALQLVDSYFMTILDQDVDDCGKRLVCEIETLPEGDRSVEENMINNLFEHDGSAEGKIDPLSARSEYQLASFIGVHYNKEACARRYHKCVYDRKTIMQALRKVQKVEQNN